jgi:hypothetical protein
MTGSRRQVRWLLPAGIIAAAATVAIFTPAGSALAQPALDDDPCMSAMNAIGNGAPGGTTSIIINNGNSSCVVSNGSNGVSVNNSVTSVSTQNGNSVNTSCINGRCCVQTNGSPPTCNL